MDAQQDTAQDCSQAGPGKREPAATGGCTGGGTTQPHAPDGQPLGARDCAIASALDIVGERWSLLAVREMTYGVHQFSRIAGYTGASRDILADRLRKLEDAGVVERRRYCEHPPRYEYHLTQAGHDLFPVMLALREWGGKWATPTPTLDFQHTCGHPAAPELRCRHCDELITRQTITPTRTNAHEPGRC
jgi:DNA-binding HxlR family transcriptional regulator